MKKEKKKIVKEKDAEKNNSYWLPIGMCLGISIGTAIGAATNNMTLWMSLGISIGLCLGVVFSNSKDNDDKK